jgi:hypothetical protein
MSKPTRRGVASSQRPACSTLDRNAGQISAPNAAVAAMAKPSTVAAAAAKARHRPAAARARGRTNPSCGL